MALPPKRTTSAPPKPAAPRGFKVARTEQRTVHRVGIYGPGGVGKTSLARLIPGGVFLNIGDGIVDAGVPYVDGVSSWEDVCAALTDKSLWEKASAVIIDDVTKAEELATAWTLANVKHEKGHTVSSVESYGYGKGYQHVFETFLKLLSLCDSHIRDGRHVVLIAHECVANVPNPEGDDWIRYEPRLQSVSGGRASIRYRIKEWVDHLLYVGFDVYAKDGKGQGGQTRTIYPTEDATHLAKSRSLADPIEYEKGSVELWKQLGVINA